MTRATTFAIGTAMSLMALACGGSSPLFTSFNNVSGSWFAQTADSVKFRMTLRQSGTQVTGSEILFPRNWNTDPPGWSTEEDTAVVTGTVTDSVALIWTPLHPRPYSFSERFSGRLCSIRDGCVPDEIRGDTLRPVDLQFPMVLRFVRQR